jgi:hypothetical protein
MKSGLTYEINMERIEKKQVNRGVPRNFAWNWKSLEIACIHLGIQIGGNGLLDQVSIAGIEPTTNSRPKHKIESKSFESILATINQKLMWQRGLGFQRSCKTCWTMDMCE